MIRAALERRNAKERMMAVRWSDKSCGGFESNLAASRCVPFLCVLAIKSDLLARKFGVADDNLFTRFHASYHTRGFLPFAPPAKQHTI
jgi:hypothetical protein